MYATCRTEACSNSGIPIKVPDDMIIMCGVCSLRIADLAERRPEPQKEMPTWLD